MSRCSNISIIRFRTQATNASTTTNFANAAYDSLTYKMTLATLTIQSNSKCRHCYVMYY